MRWMFLAVSVAAFASHWGVSPWPLLFSAFLVMCVNFASFCLLYDRPIERARSRVAERLRLLNPNSDVAQRLSTSVVTPTDADRRLGFGPMAMLNLVTGLAGIALLCWGVGTRVL